MRAKSTFITSLALVLCLIGSAHGQSTDPSSLHDALHLTAVQEAAWQRYRRAVAPDPAAQARDRAARQMMANLPTPRRIDLINAEMEANIQTMRHQGEAVKAFYATLTPDQQRVFDSQTLPRSGQAGED
jgi:hypothetical protein